MKKELIIKRIILLITPLLCVLLAIVPLCEFIALLSGTDFGLYNEKVIVIIQGVLSAGAATALFILRPRLDKLGNTFAILLLPVALLNGLCLVNPEWGWSILFVALFCGCSVAIFAKFALDSTGKAIGAVASVLLAIAVVVLYLYNLVYTSFFSEITVRKTIPSPNGSLVAEVVTDSSLLGDKTLVKVRESEPNCGVLIGAFSDKPIQLYSGEDYEIDTVRIVWEKENLVVINGEEHEINF